MEKRDVTIIIPSYNRGHLLRKTVPTYLQERVAKIVLVDDCSSDDTTEVVEELRKEYPAIEYVRQPRNMRQTVAKNRGMEQVDTEWVYFGDDDSILVPGTISELYETAVKYCVDIVGARALYMRVGEDRLPLDEAMARHFRETDDVKDIVDVAEIKANFSLYISTPVKVPFCQACLLCRTEIAKKVGFDPNYIGNAYREETDFIIGCAKNGATVYYNAKGCQFNLPTNLATGGARGKSVWKYKWYMVRNNWYFLRKNYDFLKAEYHLKSNKYWVQLKFISGFFIRPLKRLFK